MCFIEMELYAKDKCHLIILYNMKFQNLIHWPYNLVSPQNFPTGFLEEFFPYSNRG
jgi:hypothetical protein